MTLEQFGPTGPVVPTDAPTSIGGMSTQSVAGQNVAGQEGTGLDFTVVHRLRTAVAQALAAERRRRADDDLAPEMSSQDELMFADSLLNRVLAAEKQDMLLRGTPMTNEEELRAAVRAAIFGLGRLQALVDRPDLSDININGCDEVWIKTLSGQKMRGPAVADSDEELIQWVRDTATYFGLSSRPFDPANPYLQMRLPGNHRLTAQMSTSERPVVSIRLYRLQSVRLHELHARAMFTDQIGAFLTAAVLAKKSIMVVGETGSGKTTLLRGLANEIPARERLLTIEHFLELGLSKTLHPDLAAFEERPANSEGRGAVTMEDLVMNTRRMDPDRVILGECIGPEVVALLDSITQGNAGGLSTIHAPTAHAAIDKIALYAVKAPTPLTMTAAHMLTAIGLDLLVLVKKTELPDGTLRRHVASVVEVMNYDGTQVITNELFKAAPGTVQALPKAALSDELRESLQVCGYDDRHWQDEEAAR